MKKPSIWIAVIAALLGWHHCKFRFCQMLSERRPTDHLKRRMCVKWMLHNQDVNGSFSKKIMFSDEKHFQLNWYVNKLCLLYTSVGKKPPL